MLRSPRLLLRICAGLLLMLSQRRRHAPSFFVVGEPFRDLNLRPDLDHAPFLHGVASADPLPNQVLIWTRMSDPRATAVSWAVWEDEREGKREGDDDDDNNNGDTNDEERQSFDTAPHRGVATVSPDSDYTVTVDVTGLDQGTSYRYQFEVVSTTDDDDVDGIQNRRRRSAIGTTRTIATDVDPHVGITVAFLSCTSLWSGYFNFYRHLAASTEIDVVIHLGDFTYPDIDPDEIYRVPYGLCQNWDWFEPGAEAVGGTADDNEEGYLRELVRSLNCSTSDSDSNSSSGDRDNKRDLERYRWINNLYMLDPDFRSARAAHPFIVALDNHDLRGHGSDGPSDGSRRASLEWIPQRVKIESRNDMNDDGGNDTTRSKPFVNSLRHFRFGTDLLDLLVLDTYSYAGNATEKSNHEGMLGDGQHDWLDQVLSNSSKAGVRWRMFGSGKAFMPFTLNRIARAISVPFALIMLVLVIGAVVCVGVEVCLFRGYEGVKQGDDETSANDGQMLQLFRRKHTIRAADGTAGVDADEEEEVGLSTCCSPIIRTMRSAHAQSPTWMRWCTNCAWSLLILWAFVWIGTAHFLDGRLNPPGKGGMTYLNPAVDTWEGETGSMMRMFDQLESTGTDDNNFWLTGDMHYSVAADVVRFDPSGKDLLSYDPDDRSNENIRRYGVEMLAASGTRGNLDEKLGEVTKGWLKPGSGVVSDVVNYFANRVIAAMNPHFRYFQGQEHGYGVVRVTAANVEARWMEFPILRLTDDVKVGRTLVVHDLQNMWAEK